MCITWKEFNIETITKEVTKKDIIFDDETMKNIVYYIDRYNRQTNNKELSRLADKLSTCTDNNEKALINKEIKARNKYNTMVSDGSQIVEDDTCDFFACFLLEKPYLFGLNAIKNSLGILGENVEKHVRNLVKEGKKYDVDAIIKEHICSFINSCNKMMKKFLTMSDFDYITKLPTPTMTLDDALSIVLGGYKTVIKDGEISIKFTMGNEKDKALASILTKYLGQTATK